MPSAGSCVVSSPRSNWRRSKSPWVSGSWILDDVSVSILGLLAAAAVPVPVARGSSSGRLMSMSPTRGGRAGGSGAELPPLVLFCRLARVGIGGGASKSLSSSPTSPLCASLPMYAPLAVGGGSGAGGLRMVERIGTGGACDGAPTMSPASRGSCAGWRRPMLGATVPLLAGSCGAAGSPSGCGRGAAGSTAGCGRLAGARGGAGRAAAGSGGGGRCRSVACGCSVDVGLALLLPMGAGGDDRALSM